jgi:tetratricopeptide (TPR) repeat protein
MADISRLTARRLSYASGYTGLGLFKEAAAELKAVKGEDRKTAEFLAVQSELLLVTRQWEPLVRVAEEHVLRQCTQPTAWINWAYALRELERVEEAKAVLLQAESIHPDVGVLHYNLACYHCLLGEMKEARKRLTQACRLDQSWKEAAESDPDLRKLRED